MTEGMITVTFDIPSTNWFSWHKDIRQFCMDSFVGRLDVPAFNWKQCDIEITMPKHCFEQLQVMLQTFHYYITEEMQLGHS